MDVTSEGLATLSAVIDCGTFEAAAARLHITPSAVSQRIKALEQSVGRVLVRRTKPVTATPDGRVLVRLGEQWSLLVAEARGELVATAAAGGDDPRRIPRVSVPIACNADSLATWFLPVIAEFHHRLPVSVEVHRDDETLTADLLRSGDVVGAVTSDPTVVRGAATIELGSLRYFTVAARAYVDHWLPEGIRAEDLQYAPMVMFDRNDYLQRRALEVLTSSPTAPPVSYLPAAAEYRRAIQAGIGWGAIPEVELRDEVTGAGLIPLSDEPIDVPLYWQHWRLASPAVQTLTELVVDQARNALIAPRR